MELHRSSKLHNLMPQSLSQSFWRRGPIQTRPTTMDLHWSPLLHKKMLLLEARANPDTPNNNGFTLVSIAAQENAAESISKLLEARANPDTPCNRGGTPVF